MFQCYVCGEVSAVNMNEQELTGPNGEVLELCTLHHGAGTRVARNGEVSWSLMGEANLWLNQFRPSLRNDPEAWGAWDPILKLVELYKLLEAGETPESAKP